MEEIIVLNIRFNFGQIEDEIHPVVIKDDKNMILIDCGYTGFLPLVERAMEEKQLSCRDLTHVLITHQDHDHMGALYELKEKYPGVKVVAGKLEAPYISGRRKSLRLEQAEQMQFELPEDQREFGEAFCNILRAVRPVAVDTLVEDGDILDWCGGCTILGTPGHTPGHICVYHHGKNTLIAGDAAVLEEGRLMVANPQYALNLDQAEASLQKVRNCGADTIICYHGGTWVR
jgi:glyoxylase-like metal-dependent hydrolase (beta-lactamase superfamily II)